MKETVDLTKQPDGSYALDLSKPVSQAELHMSGILSGLADYKVMNIPAGNVAAGLIVAGANDALVGLFQGLVGTAGLSGKIAQVAPSLASLYVLNTDKVRGWVGDEAVQAGTLVVLADLFTDYVFNVRAKVAGIFGGLTGKLTGNTATATNTETTSTSGSVSGMTNEQILALVGGSNG